MNRDFETAHVLYIFITLIFISVISQGCTEAGEKSGDSRAENNKSETEEKICKACHEGQTKFWAYGGHAEVPCSKCHGVKGNHVEDETKPLVGGNDQCIECHEKIKDFENHLLELEKKHVIKVDREKVKNRCVYCHDPHLG